MKIKFELKKINKQNLKLHIQILSADLKFIDRKQNKKIFFSNFGFFQIRVQTKGVLFHNSFKIFHNGDKIVPNRSNRKKKKKIKRILTAFYCFWFH